MMNSTILHDAAIADLFGGQQFDDHQIQPASLDLRLGSRAWRLRASFLPGRGRGVEERLRDPGFTLHSFRLDEGAVLETGCVYLVELQEQLHLPDDVTGLFNPKSSTGRIDVFTRVVTDGAERFDCCPAGYRGPLYLEVCPGTFPILVRRGEKLAQARFRRGTFAPLREIYMTVALQPGGDGPQGYRARRHSGLIDTARIAGHDPRDFWEPVSATQGGLVLDPGEFYILASKENCVIGLDEAAEMAPTSLDFGEFRVHYAGFFDPGFGVEEPSRAVLEVRGRDVPFLVEDGQPVARLVYEPLTGRPEHPYGSAGSNYQGQGLRLSKHFAPWQRC